MFYVKNITQFLLLILIYTRVHQSMCHALHILVSIIGSIQTYIQSYGHVVTNQVSDRLFSIIITFWWQTDLTVLDIRSCHFVRLRFNILITNWQSMNHYHNYHYSLERFSLGHENLILILLIQFDISVNKNYCW